MKIELLFNMNVIDEQMQQLYELMQTIREGEGEGGPEHSN